MRVDDNSHSLIEYTETQSHFHFLYFLLGTSGLMAFNMIINAIDVFLTLTGKSDIAVTLNRFYNIPNSITGLVLCFILPRNLKVFLIASLGGAILCLCLLSVFILVPMSEDIVYWGSMVCVLVAGIIGQSIVATTMATATHFSPEHAAHTASGLGFCGVIAALLRIVTKAALDSNIGAVIYFSVGASIICATLVYLLYRLRSDSSLGFGLQSDGASTERFGELRSVFKVIWPMWAAVCANFMVTLTLFPGYVTRLPFIDPLGSWVPVIVTTVFCIGDWVGRFLPSRVMWPSERWCWLPIYGRLVFFLVFILSISGVLDLGEPYWTFLWMVPFSVSNGYMSTVAIVYGSNHSELTVPQRQMAGLLMSFAISSGILLSMCLTYAMPA